MIRHHAMPFGAQHTERGTHFRLWAPDAAAVDLCLEGERLPMIAVGKGWWARTEPRIGPGARYGYALADDGLIFPDPASRFNPADVCGMSQVVDPDSYFWTDGNWPGRPWHEAVLYELHLGTFTPEGTFAAASQKLDYLAKLGITALELMPVADFPGRCNWGYDAVLPFAPDASYGTPEQLKALVEAAHARNLMVLLDVVYNHFGPEGNYLHRYAKLFFSVSHQTPWGGASINFDGPGSETVRQFFVHNALYWLEEFHVDGLRLDAVHSILDDSVPDIVEEIAAAVAAGPGKERHIHLVLENDHNAARYLGQGRCSAQWNDDFHHAVHTLLTGETEGYYADFAGHPAHHLGRCLAEGFAWQGEPSPYRKGKKRGEPSAHLPPTAFVNFLQNHDQVGNRAFGERLTVRAPLQAVRAATAAMLLAPSIPLLFMGEEFGADTPFLFFCDFSPELAAAVAAARRNEFARSPGVPDPGDEATFQRSKLDWNTLDRAEHLEWLDFHRKLLALRRSEIAPRLAGTGGNAGTYRMLGPTALKAEWSLGHGFRLALLLNLGKEPVPLAEPGGGRLIFSCPENAVPESLPPWSAFCFLDPP